MRGRRLAGQWAILVRAWQRASKHNLSALAAGAAFFALLCLFPALTAIVSLYGLIADPSMVERQTTEMSGILPPQAVKLVSAWLETLVHGPHVKFGIGFIVSLIFAFWSGWSAIG